MASLVAAPTRDVLLEQLIAEQESDLRREEWAWRNRHRLRLVAPQEDPAALLDEVTSPEPGPVQSAIDHEEISKALAAPAGKEKPDLRFRVPRPRLVLIDNRAAPWIESPGDPACPLCAGRPPWLAYCARCSRSGVDDFLPTVSPTERPRPAPAPRRKRRLTREGKAQLDPAPAGELAGGLGKAPGRSDWSQWRPPSW